MLTHSLFQNFTIPKSGYELITFTQTLFYSTLYTATLYCIICICFLNVWGLATSRTVPGSIAGGVTGDDFRGSFRQNHVPWGRLSRWKWVPGIFPGVKAAGAYGWRLATLVVPNVERIRGLNLPGIPRATSACRGTLFFFNVYITHFTLGHTLYIDFMWIHCKVLGFLLHFAVECQHFVSSSVQPWWF